MTSQSSLIDVDQSVLVLIDIQDHFLNKYDAAKTQMLLAKTVWLIKVADVLGVPVIAMGEDIANVGPVNDAIVSALPPGTEVHSKDFFGLAGNDRILGALEQTGRRTAICVGMETDVCVAQTAIGLVDRGYRVVTLKDAVATTEWDEKIGLDRMRDAGVIISSVKALYYEWTRSVSGCRRMDSLAPGLVAAKPTGLVL
ncbi:MAG: isochorismatase family protein [Alphaproteobacteria bacterium]|nr:isochorismatase family protein [Alphaproteobacteria bacterium]